MLSVARMLLISLVLMGVVTAQLFGFQRGYVAELKGESVWTLADHHHAKGSTNIIQLTADIPSCQPVDSRDSANCDPTDRQYHAPFKLNLQMQPGVTPVPVPQLLGMVYPVPLFFLTISENEFCAPASRVPLVESDCSSMAVLVLRCIVLLV